MKIERIVRGSGHCADCKRGARFRVSWGGGARAVILCPRCSSYLATTLLARIDEYRHQGEDEGS